MCEPSAVRPELCNTLFAAKDNASADGLSGAGVAGVEWSVTVIPIAFVKKFGVATRDTKDFEHEGLVVINPWEER